MLAWLFVASLAHAQSNPWAELTTPLHGADDKMEVIGFYSSGCIRNAHELAISNSLWEVINTSRKRYFGHSQIVGLLNHLGEWSANEAKVGKLVIGDISQPAGGPMKFGHASHQVGLDVDIRFAFAPLNERMADATRENFPETQVAKHAVHKQLSAFNLQSSLVGASWRPEFATLLMKAAEYPQTERVFVSPPIKQALCDQYKPKTPMEKYPEWLRKISPYYGHDEHLHVRLACPDDAPECKKQKAVQVDKKDKTGVGCTGPRLDYWLDDKGTPGTFMGDEIAEYKRSGKPIDPVKEQARFEKVMRKRMSNLPQACQNLIGAAAGGAPSSAPAATAPEATR